jgi:aminopeptidase N
MVAFMSRKSTSKTKIAAPSVPGRTQRLALFGAPPVIEGEDAAIYDQLLARFCATVKPVDVIYEMYTADFVSLEWEVLRYRRLKWSLIRERVREALRDFLKANLEDNLYSDYAEDYFAQFLESALPEDQADSAQRLARKCARNEADAVEKVKQLLADIGFTIRSVWEDARARKAKDLVEQYERREPKAVSLIHRLLAGAGENMEALTAHALSRTQLDYIERIDRLATIAESRRNASLHEIERRRAVFGDTLRRSVQEIEDGEFEVIETTPAQGKNVT